MRISPVLLRLGHFSMSGRSPLAFKAAGSDLWADDPMSCTSLSMYLRNFPWIPRLGSNKMSLQIGILKYESFGFVPIGTAVPRLRCGRTLVAGEVHADLRCIDVPMGGELSRCADPQPGRAWAVAASVAETLHDPVTFDLARNL